MSKSASSPDSARRGNPRVPTQPARSGAVVAEAWRSGYKNKPKRLTGRQEIEALALYKAQAGNHMVADVLQISVRKLEYIITAHPEFAQAIAEAREFAVEKAIHTIHHMGTVSKNVAALIFYLKNKAGWADRKDSHLSVDVNILPRIIEASYVIEDERRALPAAD